MSKKNLKVDVTIRVLGKDLTKDEADELYIALRNALGKQDSYLFPNYTPRPSWQQQLYGDNTLQTLASTSTSDMVEVLN